MYEAYFNLKTKPFDLLPNPEFLYLSKVHKRALMYLDYGVKERAGFVVLTGDIGSGKTTLIRDLIKKKKQNTILARVFNTRVDAHELLIMINDEFGLMTEGKDKIVLLRELNEFLIEQYAHSILPVLIIDEAQNLSAEILEEVRMLSNLETENSKLLQIILVGQPELRKTISTPEMLQLRQRISINCHLHPLTRQEVEEYILHRLQVAGNRNAVYFSSQAIDIVFYYSRGIPRLINIICDFLMLSAFAEQTDQISEEMVRDIIGDLNFENQYWESSLPTGNGVVTTGRGSIDEERHVSDITPALNEITRRLDDLEKESAYFRQSLMAELQDKLSAWSNTLLSHSRETTDVVKSLSSKIERIEHEHEVLSVDSEEKHLREGLLKRLFR